MIAKRYALFAQMTKKPLSCPQTLFARIILALKSWRNKDRIVFGPEIQLHPALVGNRHAAGKRLWKVNKELAHFRRRFKIKFMTSIDFALRIHLAVFGLPIGIQFPQFAG